MTAPAISIITATYNHEKYIIQCIDSVLNQSFSDWEMIIMDDGSKDNTRMLAEEAAKRDGRIAVYSQKNVGVFRLGETYNNALNLAHGKYIAILEGDDIWLPEKLVKQFHAMEQDSTAVMTWAKAELVTEDLSASYETRPQSILRAEALYRNIPQGSIVELLSVEKQFIPALTLMFRRDVLVSSGGFIQNFGMPLVDFPTVLNISLHGKFNFIDEVLGKWRISPFQTTKTHTIAIHNGFKQFIENHLPKIPWMDETKRKQIIQYYDNLCLIAYARSGRYKLIRKEYKNARKDYLKAITYPVDGNWMWRLRSMVGLTMSFVHMDVEWIARLLGKDTYKTN